MQESQEKIKILRIITRLNVGGPAVYNILLTSGLNSGRFESLLVTGEVGENEGDMSYLAEECGVKPFVIPELGREMSLKNDLIALYKLVKLIKAKRPDIVDTQTAKAGTLGRLAAILSGGSPYIVHTFHGHVLHSYFGRFKTSVFIWIERFIGVFTDRIIVISPLQYRELCRQFNIAPARKFSVIPLGFDLTGFFNSESYRGRLRNELGIPGNVLLVGIVGRLTAIKNHKLFLQSASKVLEKVSNIKFIIVGDGELAAGTKKLAEELKIHDEVVFLGWRSDMPVVYADLDLIVLTSLNEGTPVSLIEAMASAKPVVSTAVGGVPDIVLDGKTGTLVPSEDAERLASGIIDLLQNPSKRQSFGKCGREFTRERFSKERLFRDMSKLYEGLMALPKK